MRALFLLLLGACGAAHAADEPSFVNEGVIPAPIDEVWNVFATSEGYKALGPALAEVDLRIGGVIRSRYRADGVLGDAETIENVIVDYRAPVTMTIRIRKPPASFPFKEAWKSTWTVVALTPTGEGTHLRIASYGYGSDEESLAMRRFFEAGNQQTIDTLRRHFGTPTQ
ncbi:MAG TPA: SRPBCC domain-containing protein [Gammaproteobacteria bacterium]